MPEDPSPMPTCRAELDPPCDREATKGRLCSAHYEQERRAKAAGEPAVFAPLRTRRGEGRQLTIRLDAAELELVRLAAEDDGEAVPEWVRGAIRERLRRKSR